jgi:hypothetical protein
MLITLFGASDHIEEPGGMYPGSNHISLWFSSPVAPATPRASHTATNAAADIPVPESRKTWWNAAKIERC